MENIVGIGISCSLLGAVILTISIINKDPDIVSKHDITEYQLMMEYKCCRTRV